MIVSIKNDDGVTSYDVAKIEDVQARANANVTISKVSQLEVVMEALSFTTAAHRGNLEKLFADTPEALVEQEEEEVVDTDSE
jgi:hypothetical protein